MLWVCLHFPALALNLVEQGLPCERPLVIEVTRRQRRLVYLCNASAHHAGVVPGMTIPTAQGLVDGLTCVPRNEDAEHAALQQLGHWAYQFTPHIQCHPASLVLEVSRSLNLFGGRQPLAQRMIAQLPAGYRPFTLAFCDTAQAAVLAAQAHPPCDQPYFFSVSELQDLSVEWLAIDTPLAAQLRGMGITTLAQLLALPRDALGKRFGTPLVTYLKQLTGETPDLLTHWQLPEQFSARLDFLQDVESTDPLLFPLRNLVSRLADFLCARHCATTQLDFRWQLRTGQAMPWSVALSSPVYRSSDILPLLQLRLAQTRLPAPVVGVQLQVTDLVPLPQGQGDLLTPWRSDQLSRYQLIDKLKARLGNDNVQGLAAVADHRPEYAWTGVVPGTGKAAQHPAQRRPVWLLRSPQRLTQKKDMPMLEGHLQLLTGPERIHSGWWDGQAVNRDYYVARQPSGRQLWIYRDRGDGSWYLHGVFGV
ncbi:MAG: DNA polymerase Y family protein [Gammaproteobacteria bacterium]